MAENQQTTTATATQTAATETQQQTQTATTQTDAGDWLSKLPEEAQKEIKKLRSENAEQRTKRKEYEEKATKYERERAEAAEKADAEKGEFKKLYEQEKNSRAQTEAQMKKRLIQTELKALAVAEGVLDPDVVALIPTKGVDFGDDGVSGAAEAIAAFKASKPHLFRDKNATTTEKKEAVATGAAVTKPASEDQNRPPNVFDMKPEDYKKFRDAELAKIPGTKAYSQRHRNRARQ